MVRLVLALLCALMLTGCVEEQTTQPATTPTSIIDPSTYATWAASSTAQAGQQEADIQAAAAFQEVGGAAEPTAGVPPHEATISSELTALSQPRARPTDPVTSASTQTPAPQPAPAPEPSVPVSSGQPSLPGAQTAAATATPAAGLSPAQMTAVAQSELAADQTAAAQQRQPAAAQPTASPSR